MVTWAVIVLAWFVLVAGNRAGPATGLPLVVKRKTNDGDCFRRLEVNGFARPS